MSNKLIDIQDITKSYDGTIVLDKLNLLYFEKMNFLTLLGPSGCGKTTLFAYIRRVLRRLTPVILFLTVKISINCLPTAGS